MAGLFFFFFFGGEVGELVFWGVFWDGGRVGSCFGFGSWDLV